MIIEKTLAQLCVSIGIINMNKPLVKTHFSENPFFCNFLIEFRLMRKRCERSFVSKVI